MKNSKANKLLKEVKTRYSNLQKIVDISLLQFSKNNDELQTFLFHTPLGEALRSKIARHIFDNSLIKYTQHDSKYLPLICNSQQQAIRIFNILNAKDFNKHLKSEFSCSLNASRSGNERVIVEFKK